MFIRRLAAVTSAAVLALGGTAIMATPAQAADEGCYNVHGHYEQAGAYITSYRFKACDNKPDVPLYTIVEKNLSPGVYILVAAGWGEATYSCAGMPWGVYRVNGNTNVSQEFGMHCG